MTDCFSLRELLLFHVTLDVNRNFDYWDTDTNYCRTKFKNFLAYSSSSFPLGTLGKCLEPGGQ